MKTKKILSILLSVCVILAFMPQMAFADGEPANPYTYKEGTAGAGESEGPASLIDGKTGTKWCVTSFSSAYIIFETSSAVNVSGYSITTGNDNAENKGRNPKNWKLYGCNDYTGSGTGTWEKIHSVTNDTVLQDENNTTYNFVFDKTETTYQFYKLEITETKGADVMQMSEFALTSCDHNWGDSIVKAPTCTSSGYTKKVCSICNVTGYSDYKEPLEHDFSGADGKCIYCGYSSDELKFTYLDVNGDSCTSNDKTIRITDACTTWNDASDNDGWYIVQGKVTIDNNIFVSGNVHLILADGCNLTVTRDITGGSLTIYGQANGTGKLNVSGSIISGNGVDGSDNPDNPYFSAHGGPGGSIVINGGTINAGRIASGNGGRGGNFENPGNGGPGGSIAINGGTINAGRIASGNGGNGGRCVYDNVTNGGNGGNTTISGGIVEADSITSGNGGSGNASDDAIKHGKNGDNGIIDINGGLVFQGNSGQVYGTSFTLSETLTIPAGKTLTISDDKTLINNGTIYVDGTLTGSVDNSSTGSIYYLFTLVGATATGDISKYNSKNYSKSGTEITLTPDTPQVGYLFDSWEVSLESVQINNSNSFKMPKEALTVTAQWTDCPHTGTLTYTPAVAPTYSEYGVKEYWHCSTCNAYLSDNVNKTVIPDLDSWKAGEGKIDKLTVPAKTDSVTTDKDGGVTVTLERSVTTSDSKTTATVTDTVVNQILAKLASSDSKSVVIDASAGSAASTSVVISEASLKKLAEVDGIEITLVTDNGRVVLDSKAIAAVSASAGSDGQVTLNVETVEKSNNLLKVDISISTSGGYVTDFNGGKVTVTVVIDDELKGKNPVAVYIDDNGRYYKIGGKLNEDGTFTFVTGHFSTYAVMPEAEADKVIKNQEISAVRSIKSTVTLTTKNIKRGIKVSVKIPASQKADKTGIIIYRSLKKNSGYAMYKKVKTSGSTYTITNTLNVKGNRLVKGKRYYYKARVYKVIDGKTYYGPMSSIKYIRAK